MKRNKYNLSNYKLTTFNLGELVPVGLFEVLPGDSFQHQTSAIIRMSPMVAPIMHNITARIHHFFVPHRLTWEGDTPNARPDTWENFITGGREFDDTQVVPTLTYTYSKAQRLGNYLGLPGKEGDLLKVNALPFRAYNLIFNEYYRDTALEPENLLDGNTVMPIAWEKDMFTTARPEPQLGDAVHIMGNIPVKGPVSVSNANVDTNPNRDVYVGSISQANQMIAEVASASGTTIPELRQAFALQRLQEARARFGTRYTEYLRYAFGVTSSDARLQRPEYLGGGKALVQISEVLQTAPENADSTGEYGVGDMYGHGISAIRANKYQRYFDEHGYVMTLLSLRPKAIYQNGGDRTFWKRNRNDFYQPEMALIGQQPVYNGEIYAVTDLADGFNLATWGWQDRYYEYMRSRNQVNSEFNDVLNYWHLARDFTERPALNNEFIQCRPSKRIFAEQTQDSIWCMVRNSVVARRKVARTAHSRVI